MRDALNLLIGSALGVAAWLLVASRSGPHHTDNDRARAVIVAGAAGCFAFWVWLRWGPL